MSDNARRVLVYRHWLAYMETLPASVYTAREIFVSDTKLRAYAGFVIGWGC